MISIFQSIGNMISVILIVFGAVIMLMGWYDDRPDNVTRGTWILGTGIAIGALLLTLGNLGYTIPETSFNPVAPNFKGATNLKGFKQLLKDNGVKVGVVSQFGIYLIYVLIAVMTNIAELTSYAISLVGAALSGTSSIFGVTISVLSSIAYGLYVYFAMQEIANQYKRISNMGGSDLSSFGIPIQLIIRLALPLIFLTPSFLQAMTGLTANIASSTLSTVTASSITLTTATTTTATTATSGFNATQISVEMARSISGMHFFSELVFTALCALSFFMGMFSMGKIAAIGISIGIRLIGYAIAIPVGIASFASEDYQDIGKGMIKGFLGSALQGAFVILSIQLTLILSSALLDALFKSNYSFSNIMIGVGIVSAGILAAAEEGFNLSKELIR